MAKTIEEKEIERLNEVVKAKFIYHESRGAEVQFSSGPFYKGDRAVKYRLRDGQQCEVPLKVVESINGSCAYKIDEHCVDKDGNPSVTIGHTVTRMEFVPLVFTKDSKFQPSSTDIVSVRKA